MVRRVFDWADDHAADAGEVAAVFHDQVRGHGVSSIDQFDDRCVRGGWCGLAEKEERHIAPRLLG